LKWPELKGKNALILIDAIELFKTNQPVGFGLLRVSFIHGNMCVFAVVFFEAALACFSWPSLLVSRCACE
jgi:hypothetical protein